MNITQSRTMRRRRRVSANMWGTSVRPRIAIFRSNMYIYAQAIDDEARKTLAASSSMTGKKAAEKKMNKSESAREIGKALAKQLIDKNIKAGIFDRNRYTYNGRVKHLAEGLREGGLNI